jgi:hypothetical protein
MEAAEPTAPMPTGMLFLTSLGGHCRLSGMLGAALENFPVRKQKKSFGSTHATKIETKKTSQSTIRATPKIGDFHFRRWWPIST